MKQILCFGDSNTWGLIPGTLKRYPWGVRWTSLLQEQVKTDEIRIIEEGLCGRTTIFQDKTRIGRKGTEVLPVLLESHSELDGGILMLGTNDCKTYYDASPEEIGAGIQKCLDQMLAFLPAEKILLISPIYLGENVWKPEMDPEFSKKSIEVSKQLKAVYEGIARKNGVAFLAASDYAKPSETDQEHLTAEGHRKLYQAIYKKLNKMNLLSIYRKVA